MSTPDLSGAQWRKSSRSKDYGQCVEVAATPDMIATRDSKNPTGPTLSFAPTAWSSFLSALKTDTFN